MTSLDITFPASTSIELDDKTMTVPRRHFLSASAGAALAGLGWPLISSAAPQPAGLKSGQPYRGVNISVLVPSAAQFRAQEKRLPAFEALTGIKVQYRYVPFRNLLDKITIASVSNTVDYDVVTYLDAWGPSLSPYLAPLDGLMGAAGADLSPYPSAFQQAVRYDNVTYGLPVRGLGQLLFYRKDLFRQMGIQPPETWQQLIAMAPQIHRSFDISPIAMNYGQGNGAQNLFDWLNVLWSKGGDVVGPDGRVRFNDAIGVDSTTFYIDLLKRYGVAAPGSVQFDEGDKVNSMAQGNSAMVMIWFWAYPVLVGKRSRLTSAQVGFVPVPRIADGRNSSIAVAMPFSITRMSAKKAAAAEFLKWVSSPELEVAISTDKTNPTNSDVVVTHTSSFSDAAVNNANGGLQREGIKSLGSARTLPQLHAWPHVAAILEATMSTLVTTNQPVKPALDMAAAQIDRLLRRSGDQHS
ncbi:sugar ABC transporter substrate-binding protein [Paraburkholderia nemoris]|uniref:ABC transporter substrate-binding protein n=1 Tax=Paraburkholderia nemoris TaxID=2793076 RepID=UPI0038BD379E